MPSYRREKSPARISWHGAGENPEELVGMEVIGAEIIKESPEKLDSDVLIIHTLNGCTAYAIRVAVHGSNWGRRLIIDKDLAESMKTADHRYHKKEIVDACYALGKSHYPCGLVRLLGIYLSDMDDFGWIWAEKRKETKFYVGCQQGYSPVFLEKFTIEVLDDSEFESHSDEEEHEEEQQDSEEEEDATEEEDEQENQELNEKLNEDENEDETVGETEEESDGEEEEDERESDTEVEE
ncbi:hypothetical protein ABW21_db0207912 [Orbilia brochopaga]|nr:hypothetical protein ABW21_db0207912 [Drechslerella brochopaga]